MFKGILRVAPVQEICRPLTCMNAPHATSITSSTQIKTGGRVISLKRRATAIIVRPEVGGHGASPYNTMCACSGRSVVTWILDGTSIDRLSNQ
ncbi:hypothetical protein DPMN_118512 [Dreissena polymorpha]|uniref:Uncharacterized protein n=1 Tax=Dreissena polymorpha TaxID=45954 RepID=A0A9D4GHJ5_DREPO|nr:hypothetical protein DPMN_118512 [Dreissena polymorpha]